MDDTRDHDSIISENGIITKGSSRVNNHNSLGWEWFQAMNKYSKNIAQYIADTNEKQTYGELLKRCVRTALRLKTKNLEKDDIIGLCSGNHLNTCVPYIASLFVVKKVCGYDKTLPVRDMAQLLKTVTPKIMFVEAEAVPVIEEAMKEAKVRIHLVVFGKSDTYEDFDEYLEPQTEENSFRPVRIDSSKETAIIFFSSGTTGVSKGICNSHYGLLNQSFEMIKIKNVTPITLTCSTFNWITAYAMLSSCLLAGYSRVIVSKFSAEQIWQIIDKYRVTSLYLAVFQFIELLKTGKPKSVSVSSLFNVYTGGSVIHKSHLQQLQALMPTSLVYQGFGQTEVAGFISTFDLTSEKDRWCLERKPESCGRPLRGLFYKIVDLETEKTLGPNQKGELRIKSDYLMNGYHNMDSSVSYDKDGWLKTGDLVYYDEDYCFYVVDRIKEVIKYKSFHVHPTMLQDVLLQHFAVETSLVLGIPHKEDGGHPIALVVLKRGCENVSADDIKKFVDEKVDERQQLRAGVKIVKKIPLTTNGKVNTLLIRNMILNGEI